MDAPVGSTQGLVLAGQLSRMFVVGKYDGGSADGRDQRMHHDRNSVMAKAANTRRLPTPPWLPEEIRNR